LAVLEALIGPIHAILGRDSRQLPPIRGWVGRSGPSSEAPKTADFCGFQTFLK